jgi:hypothetical protein
MSTDSDGSPHKASRVVAIASLAVLLTTVVTVLSLRLAQQFGRLSVPPLYDDVVYFLGGVRWLNSVHQQGVLTNLYTLIDQHAPFATLTAIVGFTLFPDGYVGPYAVNSVIVLAFLLGVARLTWRHGLTDIATCMIAAASVPVLWQTMTEARPDLPWGLALGLAVGAILHRPFLERSWRSICILGLLCGVAASIKPTGSPASLACIGLTAGGKLLSDCLAADIRTFREGVRRAGPPALLFAVAVFASAATLLGVHLVQTIQYVLRAMIQDRDFWVIDETLLNSLLHYSIGAEGKLALNYWLWVGLALMAMRVGFALLSDRRDIGAAATVLATILVGYLIPSLSNLKTFFFGVFFYGVFIVTMMLNFVAVMTALDSLVSRLLLRPAWQYWLKSAIHLVPLAVAGCLFVADCIPGQIGLATAMTPDQIQDIRTATARVWSLLQQRSAVTPDKVPVVVFSSFYPVTSAAIELYAAQANVPLDVRGEYFIRTAEATEQALLASDVAVISSSMPHNLPGPRMGDELIRRTEAGAIMCLVDTIPLLTIREMRVYRRGDPGCTSTTPDSR